MKAVSLSSPTLWLACLGALSGLLSSLQHPLLEVVKIFDVAIFPGVLFGLVIGGGVGFFGKTGWRRAVIALVLTVASWVVATLASWVMGTLVYMSTTENVQVFLCAGAFLAGAIGAAGTYAAAALALPELRRTKYMALTIAGGAFLGMLVMLPLYADGISWFALFGPWQALVAGLIGYFIGQHGDQHLP